MKKNSIIFRFRTPCPGSVELIKWVALLAMIIDHVGFVIFDQGKFSVPFSIGRIAFPLFAFVLAFKISAKRESEPKFLLGIVGRLFVFALVSTIPYYFAFRTIWPINVLFTLGLGVFSCYLVAEKMGRLKRWLGLSLVFFSSFLCDYFAPGVFLVLFSFIFFRRPTIAGFFVLMILLMLVAGMSFSYFGFLAVPIFSISYFFGIQVPLKKWFFYFFYPAHLMLLAAWNSCKLY